MHENIAIHSAIGDFYGKEAMRAVLKAWLNGFPNLLVENHLVICDKDFVVIQWSAMGLHQGEFKGIAATGKPVAYKGVTIYRIYNHKIVEYWAHVDMQHIFEQLS